MAKSLNRYDAMCGAATDNAINGLTKFQDKEYRLSKRVGGLLSFYVHSRVAIMMKGTAERLGEYIESMDDDENDPPSDLGKPPGYM